jgi:hypothetical protein
MSTYREIILEYMRASEVLLKTDDLTDQEIEALQAMVIRLSERLLDGGINGSP